MAYEKTYNFKVGNKVYESGTHVMAILNVTPDSFYSVSRLGDRALLAAKNFVAQGAEIVDIGGQSTRPNASDVSVLEEMSRVVPVVEAIKSEMPSIAISVDTFYPEVAQACIDLGVEMINDVSCLADANMAKIIAQNDVSVCVMHDRRKSKIDDLFLDKQIGLDNALRRLERAGVCQDRILLDGGIGFNKNNDEDWQLLDGYSNLINAFDQPFLIGTSRKSMFGGSVDTRLSATLDSTIKAARMGVLFVRVHDVKENKMVLDTLL